MLNKLPKLPYVTIYCITYNQKQIVEKTIKQLFHQEYPLNKYEVIILDDGSNDGTGEILKHLLMLSPIQMKVISERHENHYMSAKRFNQCIASASDKTEVFIHVEDVFLQSNFIWQHIKWHILNKNVLVTGASFEGKTESWNLSSCEREKIFKTNGEPVECYFEAAWAKSMSFSHKSMMLVWNEPFDIPFDERMTGWGYHEVELAYRMHRSGIKIVYDPSAGVYHPTHSRFTERQRGFDRNSLQKLGAIQNVDYVCKKHNIDGIAEWPIPQKINWIDHHLWQSTKEILNFNGYTI